MNIELTLKKKYPNYKLYFNYDRGLYFNITMIDDSYDNISIGELENYYNENKIEIDNLEKMSLYKTIRQKRLTVAQNIQTFRSFEDHSATRDSNYQRILTDSLYGEWLVWVNLEMTRMETIDWDSVSSNDVNEGNTDLFPAFPPFPDDIV